MLKATSSHMDIF